MTCPVLLHGWTPILMSMVISSGGGVILHTAVDNFPAIAMFAPVMNGAGGNLVAIQVYKRAINMNGNGKRGILERGVFGPNINGQINTGLEDDNLPEQSNEQPVWDFPL